MSELRALIFDVDGTLAETERDGHRIAFNETFSEYRLNWYWSESLYGELLAITGGKERIKFYLEHYLPDYSCPDNLDSFVAELHRDKTERYNDLIKHQKIPLRPGVQRLLETARNAGIRLAIATTTSLKNVATLLENSLDSQAMTWFDVIAAGDMVTAKKPAADIYQYALNALRLKADACIAFEDSANGIRSALGADLCTVITVSDYTREDNFEGACLVLDHLGEPDKPFTVLAGEVEAGHYVDIPLLQQLLSQQSS